MTGRGRQSLLLIIIAALLVSFLLISVLGISLLVLSVLSPNGVMTEYIAIVRLSGPIDYSSGGIFGGAMITPSYVEEIVNQLISDNKAKAVVLVVNSPGGSTAAFEVYELIKKLYESKTVVVYITGYGTSGGYLISLPSHAIVAHPTAIVGSIGAIAVLVSYSRLLDKIGVDTEIVASGELKDALSPFKEISEEDVEMIRKIVIETAEYFSLIVKHHRGDKIRDWHEILRAGIYTAIEAKRLGLIDHVGSLEDAINLAREIAGLPEDTPVIEVRKAPSLIDLLIGGSSVNSNILRREILHVEVLLMWPLPTSLTNNLIISSETLTSETRD